MNTNVQCTISLLRKLGHEVATEVHSTGNRGRDPNMYRECVASPLLDIQQVLFGVRTISGVTTNVCLVGSGLRRADQVVPGRGERGGRYVVRALNVLFNKQETGHGLRYVNPTASRNDAKQSTMAIHFTILTNETRTY